MIFKRCLWLLILTVPAALLAAACDSSDSSPSTGSGDLKVVVSLPLFADFVQQVGGDRVEVVSLLPSGADPHTFEPTPRDVQKLTEADVMIINGLGLEGPSLSVIENNLGEDVPLVELADNAVARGLVTLVEEDEAAHEGEESEESEEHAGNPHVWLDVSVARGYVEIIRDELSRVDPNGAEAYMPNAEAYLQELETLGDDLKAMIASIPAEKRKLITSHDAFPYMARYLGLEVVAFVAASPGQEPSPQDLAQLQQLVDDLDVPAVFVEPQVEAEGRVLQQVAQDIGLGVCTLYSDAFDDRIQTYVDMMRFDADELVRCLGGATGG